MGDNTIAPGVVLDGRTVYPPGWMWVLAFALRGIPWAIQEADKPEFRSRIHDYLVQQKKDRIEESVKSYEEKITQLRRDFDEAGLKPLDYMDTHFVRLEAER